MRNRHLWKKIAVLMMTGVMTVSSPLATLADTVVEEEVVTEAAVTEEDVEAVEAETDTLDQAQDPETQEISVTVRMSMVANEPGTSQELKVTSGDAAKYGLTKREATTNQVTALDAFAAWSAAEYGEDFAANPSEYLAANENGFVTKAFGIETYNVSFLINNVMPGDESGMGYAWDQAVLREGDQLNIFMYNDDQTYTDAYLYFEDMPSKIRLGEEISFKTLGFMAISSPGTKGKPVEECVVAIKNKETGEETTVNVAEDGTTVYKPEKAGTYEVYVKDCMYEYFVVPQEIVVVEEAEPEGPDAEEQQKMEAAAQHIQDTYLAEGKRLISNGGTAIVHDGNKIQVGLKTSSGNSINTIRFNTNPSKTAGYKTGVFLPEEDSHVFYKDPAKAGSSSIAITRDTAPYTFRVMLKLYDAETEDALINDDTAKALAQQEFLITLDAEKAKYDVSFAVKDSVTKQKIENARIVLYKDYSWNAISPKNGVYTLEEGSYKVDISADGYQPIKEQEFAPSANGEAELFLTPEGPSEADQAKVNAVKDKFDKELGALRPSFTQDKTIVDLVQRKIEGYTDLDIDGIRVSVKSSEDEELIALDGSIRYNKGTLSYVNSLSTGCTFIFSCNGAEAESDSRRVSIGWDQDYFKEQMQKEADALTWDSIKGENTTDEEVTRDLVLPRCMGTSARNVWSEIEWSSSDPSVIEFKDTGYGSLIDPKSGIIHAPEEDTEITLTATFKANDSVINSSVEKTEEFGTVTKTFKITVKGTKAAKPTEEELLTILDQYYTADRLLKFGTEEVLDTAGCAGDIQLPLYTRIKDADGNKVFVNREITVTSSNPSIIKINGYRAIVDVYAADQDTTVDLIVTFTRDGVTVTKRIPITVTMLSDQALDAELALMEKAKEHYFDGINDGSYADKDSVTGDLHAFQEMVLDEQGNPLFIYQNSEKKGNGIVPDDIIEDSWEMEAAGYRVFKSSNPDVIRHDNLLVTRAESNTEVTISSVLTSEKYGALAAAHKDNEKLQKLYKQEVSVTVTVKGTKGAAQALAKEIAAAKELLTEITEGSEPGQYPEGTKDKLSAMISAAEQVSSNEATTESEQEQALSVLNDGVAAIRDTQNEQVAEISLSVNEKANEKGRTSKITVTASDAEKYGLKKPEELKKEVTALDAVAAYHAAQYGDAFAADPQKYVKFSGGSMTRIFGIDTFNMGFFVNDRMPVDNEGRGYNWDEAVLKDGDTMRVFFYGDTDMYTDYYISFADIPETAMTGDVITFKVLAAMAIWSTGAPADPAEDTTISLTNKETGEELTCEVGEDGVVTFTATKPGVYEAAVKETDYEFFVAPSAEITVSCSHAYGEWKTKTAATVFKAEMQERTCQVCGETETRTVGKKLTPTIKLNTTAFPLQITRTTNRIRVTGLAKGDYVKSWKSSDTSIATVTDKGVVTATRKTGKTVLTVRLASGKTAKITVTVQKAGVKTTAIKNLPKTLTIVKGKTAALKPVRTPITSQQKVTYKTSNKSVATVSAGGVIKGVKKGKAVITVTSGNVVKKVTVTVK